jgi:hypothetical protein
MKAHKFKPGDYVLVDAFFVTDDRPKSLVSGRVVQYVSTAAMKKNRHPQDIYPLIVPCYVISLAGKDPGIHLIGEHLLQKSR